MFFFIAQFLNSNHSFVFIAVFQVLFFSFFKKVLGFKLYLFDQYEKIFQHFVFFSLTKIFFHLLFGILLLILLIGLTRNLGKKVYLRLAFCKTFLISLIIFFKGMLFFIVHFLNLYQIFVFLRVFQDLFLSFFRKVLGLKLYLFDQ